MARVLVDTSAIYALIDSSDAWHESATRHLEKLRHSRIEPLLTNFIVAECHALLLSRLGAPIARKWVLGNIWAIECITVEDEEKAKEIIRRYTDKTFSYTDTTSFSVMERLRIRQAFAFDLHFKQYGFQVIGPQASP